MIYSIFDMEANNLLPKVTKIHCLSYQTFNSGKLIDYGSITDPTEMVEWLDDQECLVGHYIIGYDIPLIKKLLDYEVTCEVIALTIT